MAAQAFDNRDGWIWLDGEFVPHREAKVHVLTHALHYASAVFEGERAYEGVVFKSRDIVSGCICLRACLAFKCRTRPKRLIG
jgi:branched chain amino acid aminotransferase apoenzyme (EC 2.6.1.42)